jgi:tetratricopeptide (TPR) repeat protein
LKRILIIVGLLAVALGIAAYLVGERALEGPRVVEPGKPLPMDETVQLRFKDEETGEEEVWTVEKRETRPEDIEPRPLPDPDPDVETHESNESSRALNAMALESWKRGEIRESMDYFEQAIEIDPDDPLPRTQYGRLLILAMSYVDAYPHLKHAAELTPEDPQVWLDLATLYEKKMALPSSWEAQKRAEALADGKKIERDAMGFWRVEGESIHP